MGRNSPSSLSSWPSLMSRVLPASWISKFERVSLNFEQKPANESKKWMQNLLSLSPNRDVSGGGDDAFRSRSFRDGKTSRGVLQSVWYDSDDEFHVLPLRKEPTYRKTVHIDRYNPNNSNQKTTGKDCVLEELSADKFSSKSQDLKAKSEKQSKSLYISREIRRKRTKQNSIVRVQSPRMAAKVKALEDIKRVKLKKKVAARNRPVDRRTGLESFAVVKSSFDPQQDFRDSMVEMVIQKRICRPEELEELLACYLTLNSDEYHDLIIKVFRQVWLDLNHDCFGAEIQNKHCGNEQLIFS